MTFASSPFACKGSLGALCFPPTTQTHVWLTGDSKLSIVAIVSLNGNLPLCVSSVIDWGPVWGGQLE